MDSDMITEKKTGKVRLRVEATPNPQPRLPIAEFEFPRFLLKCRLQLTLVSLYLNAMMRRDCKSFDMPI